jgi:hypothetical protein
MTLCAMYLNRWIEIQSSENILTKSPLTPLVIESYRLCQRGELNIIPLWKRGIKGDFNKVAWKIF